MIVIIDYNCGNIFSINKALSRLGIKSEATNDKKIIDMADKIILPGVGHFKTGIENLIKNDLTGVLIKKIKTDKVPILGICLGMQLLAKYSEEGNVEGLGSIDAKIKRFEFNKLNDLKIPHVGWNNVLHDSDNELFNNIEIDQQFYFVHSYHMTIEKKNNFCVSRTKYGYDFISSVIYENIYGVQFHPEKSHDQGLQLIKNFGYL